MSDRLFGEREWTEFCERVATKLGTEVAPEDVIDLVRELDPDLVYDLSWLFRWVVDEYGY